MGKFTLVEIETERKLKHYIGTVKSMHNIALTNLLTI